MMNGKLHEPLAYRHLMFTCWYCALFQTTRRANNNV